MRLPAFLLALGLLAGCHSVDPAEVALLHREIGLLVSMAKASGNRSVAQVNSIEADGKAAHAHVDSIAGIKTS